MANWVVYDQFKLKQNNGNAVDLDTNTIKVAILDANYTPNAADALFSAIDGDEVSGSNYTAGGVDVTSGVTLNLAGGTVTFDFGDPAWSQHASGFANGRFFIVYETGGSKLIAYLDNGADFGNVAGDLTLDTSNDVLTFA